MVDLVDSTKLAASLDPEEWREIAMRYQRVATQAVVSFGGYVARYQGDGLVVYFGYPQAHGDDAELAVRAGLGIVNAIADLNAELTAENRPRLGVRVGIDAGHVVIASVGNQEAEVFGDAANMAARVQALSEPDTVTITTAAHRLVAGLFVEDDCGEHTLKGIAQPVRLYRVLRPTGVRSRLRVTTAARGLTPLVDREDELAMLRKRWERAKDGEGQLVMITGEAGIGKSRLVHQLGELISETPHLWIECCGVPFLQNTPFHPVTETLKRTFGWFGGDSPEKRLRDVEQAVEAVGFESGEAAPLVATLLGLPLPDSYSRSSLPPEEQRRRLVGLVIKWVFAAATVRPVIVVVEDMHWIDPSTLDLLQLLAEQNATAPVLLVYTARPEFRPTWPLRAHHMHIVLNRLNFKQRREMVTRVAAGESLATEVVDAVATRTDGIPLFVEELTRLVVESGQGAAARSIPATLQDSLMARLDRLGTAKEVVQVGAVIGREFSYELIRSILPLKDHELQDRLKKADDAELLYARGLPPDATYFFKHSLVQDAAYQALLKSRRRELHHAIAKVLNDEFPEIACEHPEIVAHHYTEAVEADAAASAWQRAGDIALARGALREAEDRYAKALALLERMTGGSELEHRKLLVQVALGQVLTATRGYASPEVRAAYSRAAELGQTVGNPPQVIFTLLGVWVSNLIRSELLAAQAVADQVLAATEAHGSFMIWGHVMNGITRYHSGDLLGAWRHLESARSFQGEEFDSVLQDPRVLALGYSARAAWQLGMAETARVRMDGAIALARELKKPVDLASAYSYAAGLCLFFGENDRAREYAEALLEVATDQHMPFYEADGIILKGRAIADRGDGARGIEMMREGVKRQITNGQRVGLGYYLALLGEAQMRAGALVDALASTEEALTAVPEERVDHPRLLHLRGEIHMALATAGVGEPRDHERLAELSLQEALSVAAAIGAKMSGLRAATVLSRLLKSLGRRSEARDILAPLYAAFTEGLVTPALGEAKALLDELSC